MVDDTDLQIIEQLNSDGRKSMRKIAEELDISPSTASNRFKKLVEENVIEDIRPVVNYEKMGYNTAALIEITVTGGLKEEVLASLEDKSRVKRVYAVTGGTDIFAVCRFIDRNDMYNSLKNLQDIEGVTGTTTHVVLDDRDGDKNFDWEKVMERME